MQWNNRLELLSLLKRQWGITELNPMQQEVVNLDRANDVILYAPTGSGKTIAFAIPLVEALQADGGGVQAIVIVPSRELALQIHDVVRTLATGHKVTCLYGGHRAREERQSLSVTPSVVVATPGRLLDHLQHGRMDCSAVTFVVLDEFDKCLEFGFEQEMKKLLSYMPPRVCHILTSATRLDLMPSYVRMNRPTVIDYLAQNNAPASRMTVYAVHSPIPDKLETLRRLLLTVDEGKIIVFVGFRDAVARVADFLNKNKITAGCYHGALDQTDREKALAMFRNGSVCVLVTTDLAARGLDIDGVRHIVHYHLPSSPEAYTHRNGRTARVDAHGEVYVLLAPDESYPDYIAIDDELALSNRLRHDKLVPTMATLHILAGKKEKISRGDVLGFVAKNCSDILTAADVGHIEVKEHYTLVAVPCDKVSGMLSRLQRVPLKGHRTRITLMKL